MFKLHPQLNIETYQVFDWPLCQVRLMNDRSYPWLILIPRKADVEELFDLTVEERARLTEETTHAAKHLRAMTQADKMNVATLGNMVPQLHVHVIARFRNDLAWPKPIWGAMPPIPYEDDELAEAIKYMRATFPPPPGAQDV